MIQGIPAIEAGLSSAGQARLPATGPSLFREPGAGEPGFLCANGKGNRGVGDEPELRLGIYFAAAGQAAFANRLATASGLRAITVRNPPAFRA